VIKNARRHLRCHLADGFFQRQQVFVAHVFAEGSAEMNMPNLDSISEFRVLTYNFDIVPR